jgi:hypothetical protein
MAPVFEVCVGFREGLCVMLRGDPADLGKGVAIGQPVSGHRRAGIEAE